jgi:hypothetical protein
MAGSDAEHEHGETDALLRLERHLTEEALLTGARVAERRRKKKNGWEWREPYTLLAASGETTDLTRFAVAREHLPPILERLGTTLPEREAEDWLRRHHDELEQRQREWLVQVQRNWIPTRDCERVPLALALGELLAAYREAGTLARAREWDLVYALPWEGTWLYPLWQFDRPGTLDTVLAMLRGGYARSPWALASFLVTPNARVDADTPLDALLHGVFGTVLLAADESGDQGAA